MKKVLSFVIAFAVLFSAVAGTNMLAGTANAAAKVKIGLSTDEGGRGDKSFNDAAIAGLDRIKAKYKITPTILEAKTADNYQPFLDKLAQENDLTFGVGFKMGDAMTAVAGNYPEKKFAIVDSVVDKPNVMSLCFQEEQGSFLVGVIAGKMTKTGKVGFIGGMEGDLIKKFEAGFAAGVMSVNPKAGALLTSRKNVRYAGNFFDDKKGYELAKNLYNGGCDIIFHASGGVGNGLFKAAVEMKKWAIGVDQDQALIFLNDKNKAEGKAKADRILCSMIKRVDNATYLASEAVITGKFKAGVRIFGLKEDGVGISKTVNKSVSKTYLTLVDKYKKAIIAGKIKVPATLDAAKKFKPVVVK